MKKSVFTLGSLFLLAFTSFAQCDEGLVEVTMNVYTDAWPYESYWELTNSGNACGEDALAFGGNVNVGCEGVGAEDGPDGYEANTSYSLGPWCFEVGQALDLIFVDSYGDGGLVFEIFENGVLSAVHYGQEFGSTITIEIGASNVPSYDAPCGALPMMSGGGLYSLNNELALANINEIAPVGESCTIYGFWCELGVNNSVWASFTAEDAQEFFITTCVEGTTFDTQIALWKATDCADWSSFELVSSNDDAFGDCAEANVFSSALYTGCLEPGATYYLQIDGWYGETGDVFIEMTPIVPTVTLEAAPNDIRCPLDKLSEPDGNITVWLAESSANFIANWTGPNGFTATGNFIENLAAGSYTVSVVNACGAEFSGTYELTEPQPWNVISTIESPQCSNSENGAIELSVSGGAGGYTYFWTGPANFTAGSMNISGIEPGQYDLSIEDINECEYAISFVVEAINDLELELGPDTVVCQNVVFDVNGPAGFSYLWQDESTSQNFTINAAEFGIGDHYLILTISTGEGCTAVDVFNFTVDACIGVEEKNSELSAIIYPNPTRGNVRLEWMGDKNAGVHVFDSSGRVVYQYQTPYATHAMELPLQLAPGYYTVVLHAEGQQHMLPLLVE